MTDENSAENRLLALTHEDAKDWIVVGRLLLDLESQSRASPSGRPWQDVIRDRLTELNASISSGHVHKLRRAIAFLSKHAPDAISSASSFSPKISAIEVAERLYRLDPNAGKKALADVLAPEPVTYVELQKRYSEALQENPEMKSPRQLAWEARRKTEKTSVEEGKEAPPSFATMPKVEVGLTSDQHFSGPSTTVRQKQAELLSKVWAEGEYAAEQKYASEVKKLRNIIESQAEEISIGAQAIRDLEGEVAVLSKQIRELRGDYSEDVE
jgi:hypothetical protein